MVEKQVDVLIVGGGLMGATLMLALQELGVSTLLVEAHSFSDQVTPDFDARSLALSPASQRILNMLGVWTILQEYASPIESIHVSDQHRFGVSRFQGKEKEPLGYVVEMQYIHLALQRLLPQAQVMAPATLKNLDVTVQKAIVATEHGEVRINAQLIVAADGAQSAVRQLCNLSAQIKNYNQQAIVANIALTKSHAQRAFERFTPEGPLALLPMQGNRMSLVWAMNPEKAKAFMMLADADFLVELQRAFGYRLGRFAKVGKRFVYPLQQIFMTQQTKWPVVFVGNAAHTLHPVAGQGFNLGLRDVATLVQCIAQQGLNAGMLHHYVQLRHPDQHMIRRFTDGLVNIFTSRLPGIGFARNVGLLAVDANPVLKNILARYAQGFGGVIPDLVCDIALSSKESQS